MTGHVTGRVTGACACVRQDELGRLLLEAYGRDLRDLDSDDGPVPGPGPGPTYGGPDGGGPDGSERGPCGLGRLARRASFADD